jgi:HEAT repeats
MLRQRILDRLWIIIGTLPLLGLEFGCAHHTQPAAIGLIPPAEYAADVHDDYIRKLGEDRAPPAPLNYPIYFIPVALVGSGIDIIFVEPTIHLYKHFTGDTPDRAARDILDLQSADNRRYGILRLSDEKYARDGKAERDLWALRASTDPDYTVRAAGIRALNRCRDATHTDLYIKALNDDEPLVRLEGAKALANIPDPNAATPLLERLQRDVSPDVRIAAADALRCYPNDEAAHGLLSVLNDSNFGVCWQARQSLRLMTAHDFRYSERLWLDYLASQTHPFVYGH